MIPWTEDSTPVTFVRRSGNASLPDLRLKPLAEWGESEFTTSVKDWQVKRSRMVP
jgi:hypothetical protein